MNRRYTRGEDAADDIIDFLDRVQPVAIVPLCARCGHAEAVHQDGRSSTWTEGPCKECGCHRWIEPAGCGPQG